MKELLILSILYSHTILAQKISQIYKLAINDKNELVYVFDKSTSYPIDSDNGKERIIFDLLKDSMKRKKIALIVCTGEGSIVDGKYVLVHSRMCKDSNSSTVLYTDFDVSVKDAIVESKNIDLVLSQGSDFSDLAKSVADTGRFVIEKDFAKKVKPTTDAKTEAIAK